MGTTSLESAYFSFFSVSYDFLQFLPLYFCFFLNGFLIQRICFIVAKKTISLQSYLNNRMISAENTCYMYIAVLLNKMYEEQF